MDTTIKMVTIFSILLMQNDFLKKFEKLQNDESSKFDLEADDLNNARSNDDSSEQASLTI